MSWFRNFNRLVICIRFVKKNKTRLVNLPFVSCWFQFSKKQRAFLHASCLFLFYSTFMTINCLNKISTFLYWVTIYMMEISNQMIIPPFRFSLQHTFAKHCKFMTRVRRACLISRTWLLLFEVMLGYQANKSLNYLIKSQTAPFSFDICSPCHMKRFTQLLSYKLWLCMWLI